MQSSRPSRPRLLIVSGAPGSGKTTLAARLAVELRLPLLTKDGMKETLADVLGVPDLQASMRLGEAAYAVLYEVLGRVLAGGAGAIIESNFRRDRSEAELRPFLEESEARLIHCHAAPELVFERYTTRMGAQARHSAHRDEARLGVLTDELAEGRFEPLRLDIPTLRVDTTNGYRPPLGEILTFAAGAVAA
jgi:Predicted kinase